MITTQKALRDEFWRTHPQFRRTRTRWFKLRRTSESLAKPPVSVLRDTTQNEYSVDIRMAWCDFVDAMYQNDQISKGLAERATL